jgi:signal transduction histidine kinase
MLERLCDLTAEVLQGNSCCTLLWQPQSEDYSLAASWGYTPEQQEILRVLRVRQATIKPLIASLDSEHVVELRTLMARTQMSDAWLSPFAPGNILCLQLRRGQELLGLHLCGYATQEPLGHLRYRIARGISQIASLALANAKLVEELARANSLKNDFLATMSHELRTPLNIIMGYTDLLIEGDLGPLTEDQRKSLYSVGHSARELLNLITATLDVSRMEAGRMPIETDAVDVEELLEELQQETEREGRKEGLLFRWRVEPQLPVLYTDRIKLKVIIKNLLGNAIKFTRSGTVTVLAALREDQIEIRVQDTGIGIASETLPVIFDMFRQGDSSDTRLYGGVGLGLYIVRRLLDLLQGTVTVESTVGQGSTFTIALPLRPPTFTLAEQFSSLSSAIRPGR